MGKPKKVTLADGAVRYRVVYDAGRDPETGKRRQITRTFDRKKDADAELARVAHQRSSGSYVPPSRLTLNVLLDSHLKSTCFEKEAGTKSNYTHALRPARERLGDRLVQSIAREDIEDLRDWMLTAGRKRGGKPGTGLGARSVQLTLSRLSAAFEEAVDDGKITRNPCRRVKLPKLTQGAKEAWTVEEARQFLAEASTDRLHAAWTMLMYAARREEVCGARWERDIDLDARTWTIGLVRVVVDGKVVVKEVPKTDSSARTLPLDDALVAALKALRKRQLAERLAAGEAYSDSGYVVCDELGNAVNPEWLSDEFVRVAKRAGVRRMTPHNARHTALTLMEQAGLPVSFIAAWAGHKDHSFTMKRYVHKPADLAPALDALSQLYGG